MKGVLHRVWFGALYYLSWLLFGLGGLVLNLACLPLLLLPQDGRPGARVRSLTRWLFGFWSKWLHATGVARATFHGFPQQPVRGVVYVANHPSLVDAPLLLSRLEDTVCIFKPALLRNPCIGPAAILCGYVSAGDQGVDLIRSAAERIRSGCSLLIFPEGTRTAWDARLNPMRPGFALIARRAGCDVHVIGVRTSPLLARRGRSWWKLPPLPAWCEFSLLEIIPAEEQESPAVLTARVERRLLEAIA